MSETFPELEVFMEQSEDEIPWVGGFLGYHDAPRNGRSLDRIHSFCKGSGRYLPEYRNLGERDLEAARQLLTRFKQDLRAAELMIADAERRLAAQEPHP